MTNFNGKPFMGTKYATSPAHMLFSYPLLVVSSLSLRKRAGHVVTITTTEEETMGTIQTPYPM